MHVLLLRTVKMVSSSFHHGLLIVVALIMLRVISLFYVMLFLLMIVLLVFLMGLRFLLLNPTLFI